MALYERPKSGGEADDASASVGFDVRGWELRTPADERHAGRIEAVLYDDAQRPRFLVVRLGREERRVLLPIGEARMDASQDVVWVPGLTVEDFETIPSYPGAAESVSPEYERRVERAYAAAYRGERFYADPAFRGPASRLRGGPVGGHGTLAYMGDRKRYRIANDDPDPRGWPVIAADRVVVGRVERLVVDPRAGKVRYLELHLSGLAPDDDGSDRRLIPIGYSRLDEDNRTVLIDVLDSTGLAELPAPGGLPLDRAFEERLFEAFLEGVRDGDPYRHPRYSPERFHAPRRAA